MQGQPARGLEQLQTATRRTRVTRWAKHDAHEIKEGRIKNERPGAPLLDTVTPRPFEEDPHDLSLSLP